MKYDPMRPPNPGKWLTLSEQAQIELVAAYHRKHRIRLPNPDLHAAIHATVESQVAAGEELPVAAAVDRLVSEGLDRHEAIHAVGMVLTGVMADAHRGRLKGADPSDVYLVEIEALDRETWERSLDGED